MTIDTTRATTTVDTSFLAFDTAKQADPVQADGRISMDDLRAVASNQSGTFTAEEVGAAQFLLQSQAARSFLDVGAGEGNVDGTISREDIDGALLTIESGGLDQALLDTAAGRGGADGYVGESDIVAALRDPGIRQGLKDALAHLPPGLPLQTQLGAVFALHNHASDPHATRGIGELIASQAFRGLEESQQRQALALFGGTNEVAALARADLGGLDPNSTSALQDYLSLEARPADKWRDAQPATGVPDHLRKDYQVTGPEAIEYDFPSRTQPDAQERLPAWKYIVEVDGQSIEVIVPQAGDRDSEAYSYPTVDQIAKGLAAQPSVSLAATDTVVLLVGHPKTKDENGNIVDNTAPMWAGNSTVTINPSAASDPREQKNLDYTFLHETAHLVEQPWVGGSPWLPPGWTEAVQTDRLFSTHYADNNYFPTTDNDGNAVPASNDPTEDFAEAYMIYHAVKGTPDEAQMRALMPARFEILDRMFPS